MFLIPGLLLGLYAKSAPIQELIVEANYKASGKVDLSPVQWEDVFIPFGPLKGKTLRYSSGVVPFANAHFSVDYKGSIDLRRAERITVISPQTSSNCFERATQKSSGNDIAEYRKFTLSPLELASKAFGFQVQEYSQKGPPWNVTPCSILSTILSRYRSSSSMSQLLVIY